MATFTFSATMTVSAYTEVEADTYKEALDIAEAREVAGLCNQPFDTGADESWHIDTDGEPQNIVEA